MKMLLKMFHLHLSTVNLLIYNVAPQTKHLRVELFADSEFEVEFKTAPVQPKLKTTPDLRLLIC